MSVKKVVFRGIKSNKTYLAMGGIRFLEYGNVIQLVNPTNETSTSISYANANITVNSAFVSQGGWISNAFTTNKPQTGYTLNGANDTNNNYWLSTDPKKEHTISINFNKVRFIDEIQFVPNPQYNADRDSGTSFFIDFYNSSDVLLKTYEMVTISERDVVQRLMTNSNKCLFVINDAVKYINSDMTWGTITNTLTSQDFINHGMSYISSEIQQSFENEFGKQYTILNWSNTGYSTKIIQNITHLPQIAYPIGDISLLGVSKIDSISLNAIGNVKLAVSFDKGASWLSNENGEWIIVENAHQGMSIATLNSLSSEQIEIIRANRDVIRFSYSISGNSEIDKLELKVSMEGTERILQSSDFDMTYDVSTKTITYNIKRDMTVSCNYLDA